MKFIVYIIMLLSGHFLKCQINLNNWNNFKKRSTIESTLLDTIYYQDQKCNGLFRMELNNHTEIANFTNGIRHGDFFYINSKGDTSMHILYHNGLMTRFDFYNFYTKKWDTHFYRFNVLDDSVSIFVNYLKNKGLEGYMNKVSMSAAAEKINRLFFKRLDSIFGKPSFIDDISINTITGKDFKHYRVEFKLIYNNAFLILSQLIINNNNNNFQAQGIEVKNCIRNSFFSLDSLKIADLATKDSAVCNSLKQENCTHCKIRNSAYLQYAGTDVTMLFNQNLGYVNYYHYQKGYIRIRYQNMKAVSIDEIPQYTAVTSFFQ